MYGLMVGKVNLLMLCLTLIRLCTMAQIRKKNITQALFPVKLSHFSSMTDGLSDLDRTLEIEV